MYGFTEFSGCGPALAASRLRRARYYCITSPLKPANHITVHRHNATSITVEAIWK